MKWIRLIGLAFLVTACGASAPASPTPTLAAEGEASVRLAVSDLAGRLSVSQADIVVKKVEAVEWPSAALGCPQPGMMYAQVITPGYRVTLLSGGKEHVYHSDKNRVVYCPPK